LARAARWHGTDLPDPDRLDQCRLGTGRAASATTVRRRPATDGGSAAGVQRPSEPGAGQKPMATAAGGLPKLGAVTYYSGRWTAEDAWERRNATLRERIRVWAGRNWQWSAAILDSQTVWTAGPVGSASSTAEGRCASASGACWSTPQPIAACTGAASQHL
jgi:hypothetical protein